MTFFARFGHQGLCVLPAHVLCNDPLTDPDTGQALPSVREEVCVDEEGHHHLVCYARVLKACGDGLYWADVAATPELATRHRVVLREEDLYFALPYDVRVQGKSPAHLLSRMQAPARAVRPLQRVKPTPQRAPIVPLAPLATVQVSPQAVQEALGPREMDPHPDTKQRPVCLPISAVRMQRAFLQVLSAALEAIQQDETTRRQRAALAGVQRWQRETRQRCVNAIPLSREGQAVWQLTVGLAA